MAISILTDVHVIVNSVTLSDHGNRVTIEDNREEKDITGFGAANRAWGKGLGDATITVQFFQDFAAGEVYATLQPLIASSTAVDVEIRPTSAARSATNPAAVMSSLLFSFNMLDGDIGEPSQITAVFRNASQTGLQYLTA